MADKNGKVAFVTGGSRGIGAAVVRRLAEDGFTVAFTYVKGAAAAEALADSLGKSGRNAVPVQVDSADAAALARAVDGVKERFGRIDVLVNNAGIAPEGTIDDVSLDVIDNAIAVNTRAVLIASRASARHMQPGGRIVSIGSNLAERVPFSGITLYAMTKSALVGLTRGLARDYGPRGINVNLVNPGSTDTDMNPADGESSDYQRTLTALGHFGQPDDIAAMVSFLAGDGGRNVTGAMLTVDGGTNA